MKDTCATCKFYFNEHPGQCRRHAPQALVTKYIGIDQKPAVNIASIFPPVSSYDWCGDFEKKNEPEIKA